MRVVWAKLISFDLHPIEDIMDIITLSTNKYGVFGKHNGNPRIWHFHLLEMAWHQTKMHCDFKVPLTRSGHGRKKNAICNLCNKIYAKESTAMYKFIALHKISHNFQCIHHHMMSILKFCVHLVSHYWHCAKLWLVVRYRSVTGGSLHKVQYYAKVSMTYG